MGSIRKITRVSPLAEDAHAETAAITNYPNGVSIMPVSAAADWDGEGWPLVIVTERTGTDAHQRMLISGFPSSKVRAWYEDADPLLSEWSSWTTTLTQGVGDARYVRRDTLYQADDLYVAAEPIGSYGAAYSLMRLTSSFAAANGWPAPTGEKIVITELSNYAVVRGRQTVVDIASGIVSRRIWDGSAWSAWESFSMEGHTHTGYVATTDYDDADVLAKVKNVDGTGSGLDSDTLDGQHASAFLTSVPSEYLTQTEGDTAYKAAGYVPAWTEITSKPATFPHAAHDAEHNAHNDARYKAIGYVPAWTDVTGKPTTFPPDAHNHDALYRPIGYVPAWTEITSKPTTFPPDLTDHLAASDPHPGYLTPAEGSAAYKAIGYVPAWGDITSKPTTFAPDLTDHLAASDPHTGYQRESEKDANSGYVGKDASGGVLLPYTEYARQAALTPPATPGSAGARIYTISADGNTVLEGRTETGGRFRFLRDQLLIGRNNTGSTITKGSMCRLTGWDATNEVVTIALADNTAESTMHAYGIASADIPNATSGRVWNMGVIGSLNTSGMAVGATLWLGAGGAFTTTKPTTVGHNVQIVGEVLTSDATTGMVHVNVGHSYTTIASASSGGRTMVRLASDVTNGSAAANALFDITGLSFTANANTNYNFHAHIDYDANNTANGARFTCNGPAFTRLFYTSEWTLTATSMAARSVQSTYNAGTIGATSILAGNMCIMDGTVWPSAQGTFILRAAYEAIGPANVMTIKAGSTLEYW